MKIATTKGNVDLGHDANNPADHLIEAIKSKSEREDGVTLNSAEILKRASKILEDRLND